MVARALSASPQGSISPSPRSPRRTRPPTSTRRATRPASAPCVTRSVASWAPRRARPRRSSPRAPPRRRRAAGDAPRSTRSGAAAPRLGRGFRRSALVSLDVPDLLFSPAEGIAVTLRRDKTDQEGRGRTIAIPFGSSAEVWPVRSVRAGRAPLLHGVRRRAERRAQRRGVRTKRQGRPGNRPAFDWTMRV